MHYILSYIVVPESLYYKQRHILEKMKFKTEKWRRREDMLTLLLAIISPFSAFH